VIGRRIQSASLIVALLAAASCKEKTTTTPDQVLGVTVTPQTLSLQVGGTSTLTANVLVTGALNRTVTWSSNDPPTASVTQAGVVTANKVGTATIVARSTVDSNVSASVAVTVTGSTALDPRTFNGNYRGSGKVDDNGCLFANAVEAEGNIFVDGNGTGSWELTVANGWKPKYQPITIAFDGLKGTFSVSAADDVLGGMTYAIRDKVTVDGDVLTDVQILTRTAGGPACATTYTIVLTKQR
jgi:hypothetical protein